MSVLGSPWLQVSVNSFWLHQCHTGAFFIFMNATVSGPRGLTAQKQLLTRSGWMWVFFSFFFFLFVGCLSVSVCARSHKKWVFCFPLSPPVTHYLGAAWIRVRTAYIKIRHETSSSYEHSVRQLFQMWINKSGNFNLDLLLRAFRSDADQEWKKPGLDPFSLCLLLIESYRW